MDDKYLHYSINDFLEDDDFVKQLKGGSLEQEIWKAKLKGHPKTLENFKEAIGILHALQFEKSLMQDSDVEEVWQGIQQKTGTIAKNRKVVLIRRLAFAGVAASLLIAVVMFTDFFTQHKQISSYAGEHLEYSLPDDTKVNLNAVSYLQFNKRNFDENREIKMEGEVQFEVTQGAGFLVLTPLGSVRVTGTVFNVYSRDSVLSVACYEGSVEVQLSSGQPIALTKNEGYRIDYRSDDVRNYKLTTGQNSAWLDGRFAFENVPLQDVLAELERQYNLLIDTDEELDVESRHYTGQFTDKNLEKALQAVCWPLHLQYEIQGKQIRIYQQ